MNDKAKKVLSYVACALGGACLGIALLGGLSYCSTNSAREKAETINTIDRVRHNANITTQNGGYSGYEISIPTLFYYQAHDFNQGIITVYNVDISTYDLTTYERTFVTLDDTSTLSQCNVIKNQIESLESSTTLRLFVWNCTYADQSNGATCWSIYMTFVMPSQYDGNPMSFILTTEMPSMSSRSISSGHWYWLGSANFTQYYLTAAITDLVYFRSGTGTSYTDFPSRLNFQDVESYYKSQGYQDGYEDGETAGNSAGYASGYSSGYEAGSSAGYESGYDQGFQDGYLNTYYAFTSLIANQNAIWSMADIPWHSNEDIYIAPGHLNDHPFLDPAILQTNTYVNWAYLALFRDTTTLIPYYIYAQRYTTSQNNGYVNFVIRISPADQTSTENAGNIGSYSGGVSLSETSIFQTENVTEWTAPNRCQLIAWGSENPQDIDTNWFDSGHILPRGIAVDESAYDQGYKQGQLDAQRNTSMNNVFALFTPAFGAVASFFDMKIFGFLPLYWFLIAPLFIALISLIMRMVKH